MCLNCLPYYKECCCGMSLRTASKIITITQIVLVIIFIIVTFAAYPFGLKEITDKSSVSFLAWFIVGPCVTIVANFMAILVWSRALKDEDVCDIILQIYFWLFVAAMVIHLAFCITLIIFCYAKCLLMACLHLGVYALVGDVIVYCMLMINSYRISLWI